MVIEANKVGRPEKYMSNVQPFLNDILEWIKNGMNEYSICDKLGISRESWIQYKNKYIELSDLYARATCERNCLVMNAQFEKAKGIKETIKRPIKIKEVTFDEKGKKNSEKEHIEYFDELIYVPPDTNAADLYLRNHMDNYKSAKTDLSAGNVTINNFNSDEWQSRRQQILSEIQKLEAIELKESE